MMQLLVVLSAVVAGLFLFWGVPFLLRPGAAARWLALFAIGISLNMLTDSLEVSLPPMHPMAMLLLVIGDIVLLLAATAGLWFHVRVITGRTVTRTNLRWTFLAILLITLMSPELLSPELLRHAASTPAFVLDDLPPNPAIPTWVDTLGLFQLLSVQAFMGIRVLWCLRAAYRYKHTHIDALPAQGRLLTLLWATLLAFCSWLIQYGVAYVFAESQTSAIAIQLSCLLLMGLALGWYSIQYYALLTANAHQGDELVGQQLPVVAPEPIREATKYDRSPLTPAAAEALALRLQAYLTTSGSYRQPGLSLDELADALEVSPHALSQAMNQHLQLNFYELVNQYRVQDACRQLSDPARREQSLLAIAFEAGFQSKSTFNSAFKKLVGETPSLYRERALHPDSVSHPSH